LLRKHSPEKIRSREFSSKLDRNAPGEDHHLRSKERLADARSRDAGAVGCSVEGAVRLAEEMHAIRRKYRELAGVEWNGMVATDIGVCADLALHASYEDARSQIAVREPDGRGQSDANEHVEAERLNLRQGEVDSARHATG
jgi:hypothetical protein